MTTPLLPPKTEPLIDDDKFCNLNWLILFDQFANGDFGTTWTPNFVGLTEVGPAVKTGIYYRISKRLCYFRIIITPNTNTSAVLGTTYCDNFPLTINANGSCNSTTGFTSASSGVTSSPKRIYTATWSLITSPITITGIIEAS